MSITSDLTQLKAQIEKSKTEKAQAEGRLAALMEQLEKEHGCATIEEAKTKLDKLEDEEALLEEELTAGIKELKEAIA